MYSVCGRYEDLNLGLFNLKFYKYIVILYCLFIIFIYRYFMKVKRGCNGGR